MTRRALAGSVALLLAFVLWTGLMTGEDQRYSELDKVTVFHALWIPCIDGGGPHAWDGLLTGGRYRVILATDAPAVEWLRARPDTRLLAADNELAFFVATES